MEKSIIKVDKISMKFKLTKDKIFSLKEYFIKFLKRELKYEEFKALTDISFELKKGEILGIIGFNGSGKSTMLKVISGIMKPTEGSVEVKGSISPLIELGSGFDMELTARENVFLNGYTLGYSKKFLKEHFDKIIEFAELKEFINIPLKNFSSGMIARLGFAIATTVNPEILIVDEILSVGDFKFQEKSENRIREMIKNDVTVIIVSHSIKQIEELCTKVLWLDKGKIRDYGETKRICEKYKKS